jgi:hypothetical protein
VEPDVIRALLLAPLALLAAAFAAGALAGLGLVAALPVARRFIRHQAAQLQLEAEALARWQEIVAAYRPRSRTTRSRADA